MQVRQGPNRPFLIAVSSHWVSLTGLALSLTALISTWMFVLPVQVRGHAGNPYIGLLVFIVIPMIFFAGLGLIPLGIFLGRRRIRKGMEQAITDPRLALRRLALFLGAATLVNLIVGTQVTYQRLSTWNQFSSVGRLAPPNDARVFGLSELATFTFAVRRLPCGPGRQGLGRKQGGRHSPTDGWLLNNYPRPIASAMESDKLVPSSETCERCHWPDKFSGARLRVKLKYSDDEANSESQTALTMLIGGNKFRGIHGSHFGNGVKIRYQRQTGSARLFHGLSMRIRQQGKTRISGYRHAAGICERTPSTRNAVRRLP